VDSEPAPSVAIKMRKRTAEEIASIEHGLDLIDNVDPTHERFKLRLRGIDDNDRQADLSDAADSNKTTSTKKCI
jgi:hypothetical protein